jgi:hypothetical protein
MGFRCTFVLIPLSVFLTFSVAEAALSPPSSLTAAAVLSSQINLTWVDTNTGETGYSVERSLNSTSGFVVVGTTGKDVKTYPSTGLASATTYYYRVRATGKKGVSSSYSNVASAMTLTAGDTTAPSVPANLTASGRAVVRSIWRGGRLQTLAVRA